MAEAFAVLGIAANIAQFVGYVIQLISEGKEIYDSLHGARDEHHELEIIIKEITKLSEELQTIIPQPGISTRLPSGDEKAIWLLAEECKPLADQLLHILNDLKVPTDRRFRGLETVRQTFRSAKKRKEIEELKRRLLDIDKRLRVRAFNMLQK
jgi:hypothetical protein